MATAALLLSLTSCGTNVPSTTQTQQTVNSNQTESSSDAAPSTTQTQQSVNSNQTESSSDATPPTSAKAGPETEPTPTKSAKETFPIAAGVNTYYFDQEIEGRVVQRPWILHVPITLNDNSPRPLLFAFHGNGGNAQSWVRAMDRWTNELNIIGVYLQGHLDSWNLGAERSKANDIEFVQKVFETLAANPTIDTNRVVALGTSNGGGMVFQLAGRTEIFSAVAAVVTHLAYGWEPNTHNRPVSILQISAQGDPLIPYGGGQSPVGHRFYPAEQSAQIWASHNQCASSATQRTTDEGSTVLTWNRCRDNTRVHHWGIDIQKHHIPDNTEGGLHQLIFEFFGLG